eukprot:3400411-Rhodomonas_salina.8
MKRRFRITLLNLLSVLRAKNLYNCGHASKPDTSLSALPEGMVTNQPPRCMFSMDSFGGQEGSIP